MVDRGGEGFFLGGGGRVFGGGRKGFCARKSRREDCCPRGTQFRLRRFFVSARLKELEL